jgi:hypothetical protein
MSTLDRAISGLTQVAAECHRSKWKYSDDKDKRPFDDLHRIGDMALKLRDQMRTAAPAPPSPIGGEQP